MTFWSSRLHVLSAGITGVQPHTRLSREVHKSPSVFPVLKLNSINNVETLGVEQEDKIESHLFIRLSKFPESLCLHSYFPSKFPKSGWWLLLTEWGRTAGLLEGLPYFRHPALAAPSTVASSLKGFHKNRLSQQWHRNMCEAFHGKCL